MHADIQQCPSGCANSEWLRFIVDRFRSPDSIVWVSWRTTPFSSLVVSLLLVMGLFYPGSEDGSLCFPCPPSHSSISPHWLKVSPTTVPGKCEAGSRLASRRIETYSALLFPLAGCSLAVDFYLILSDIWSTYFIIRLIYTMFFFTLTFLWQAEHLNW